jgi:hypothetical protein
MKKYILHAFNVLNVNYCQNGLVESTPCPFVLLITEPGLNATFHVGLRLPDFLTFMTNLSQCQTTLLKEASSFGFANIPEWRICSILFE